MIAELARFIIPCGIINIALNFLYPLRNRYGWLKKLDKPIDFGANLGRHRLLGDSTTVVGLPLALLVGIIIESFFTTPLIGLLKGLTVYTGHALGSFVKRRMGKSDGFFVPIIDHGDYIITTGLIFYFLHLERLSIVLISIPIVLVIHPLFCYVGYKLGIKRTPW